MGALDSNGIYIYDETDERDTFSDLLNIAQEATSDAVLADRARLAALESAGTLGSVASGHVTAVTGWAVSTQESRKKNGIAFGRARVTRTGAAISVGANGDIANQTLATFNAGWIPASGMRYPASAGDTGPVAAGYVDNGGLQITALSVGATLPTGFECTFIYVYPLA